MPEVLANAAAGLVDAVRQAARPLTGAAADYDALLELIGDARLVLLGEASHGTREFYRARCELTQRFIQDQGFTAVTAEADWPDAYRVNCYVRGTGGDRTADEALADFRRFPGWMWRNADVLDFVGWLRAHNDQLRGSPRQVGFYGLDLYSLYGSILAVLGYLDTVDPEAARRARYRHGCFEDFGEGTQAYGYAASFDLSTSCEQQVVEQLVDLQRKASEYARRNGRVAEDELFFAEQNARVVRNAEAYYRTMFRGRVSSWNPRDRHMAETLDALAAHLSRGGRPAKLVVWAHNSHLGDARATELGEQSEWNVGRLVRERHGQDAVLIGFSTYTGSVTAASDWDEPPRRKRVRPALPDSYEALFHAVGVPAFVLALRGGPERLRLGLRQRRLERAIGVIYRPETERSSHYFRARLADHSDAVLHFDQTRAVEPLERSAGWQRGEAPETYPVAV
jgi:erythromycin esterase-like protein